MNHKEAMDYIQATVENGMKFGLDKTEKLLDILGNPHKELKMIHIGGTNGKGSTTAMLSSILTNSGYKVGMFTSPYVEEFEERIQISGENISKDDMGRMIGEVAKAADELGEGYPTFFEVLTCAAFLYYKEQQVDYAVIEVGLGGRLDSTNVITPILSIITSISYDHMNILGNTIEEITSEKAGIIKKGVPVVTYPNPNECREVIANVAKEMDSKVIQVEDDYSRLLNIANKDSQSADKVYQEVYVKTAKKEYTVKLALLGEHQVKNVSVVLSAIEELRDMGLNISDNDILDGLKSVKWPARLETVAHNPRVVVDGAHNLGGILTLAENIKTYFNYNKLVLIIGILADKEVDKMVEAVAPLADKVIALTPNSHRATTGESLLSVIEKYNSNCEEITEYEEAFKVAKEYCGENDMIVATGSFYMISDLLKVIRNNN